MTSWTDVATRAPELASAVRATFAARKHATMATVAANGAPRISGTEVEFGPDGQIYLGMMPGTRRAADLRREPRVALHSPTVDPPAEDAQAWPGEGKISAHAVEVKPDRFRLDIDTVVLTEVAGDVLRITRWRAADSDVAVFHRD
jgi:hypothetical protein